MGLVRATRSTKIIIAFRRAPKKRARAFPTLRKMVEARKRNDPPDKNYREDKRTLVLTGELYQVEVGVTTIEAGGQHILLSAALEKCSGSNLIRKIQLPYGSEVIPLYPPVVTAGEGNP
jgi:hypothetical protein